MMFLVKIPSVKFFIINTLSWSAKRWRCTTGSFNSVYALQSCKSTINPERTKKKRMERRKQKIWVKFRVAYFMLVDEKLESFGQAWLRSMPLCQWTHNLRMVDDESRIYTRLLKKVSNKLCIRHKTGWNQRECKNKIKRDWSNQNEQASNIMLDKVGIWLQKFKAEPTCYFNLQITVINWYLTLSNNLVVVWGGGHLISNFAHASTRYLLVSSLERSLGIFRLAIFSNSSIISILLYK